VHVVQKSDSLHVAERLSLALENAMGTRGERGCAVVVSGVSMKTRECKARRTHERDSGEIADNIHTHKGYS
jgi:hypothetical protein